MELMRRVTLGQFVERPSPIHRLDPRVKLIGLCATMALVFVLVSPWSFAAMGAMLIAVAGASQVGVGYYLGGLRSIVYLALVTAVFNLVFTREGNVVFHRSVLWITDAGLHNSWLVVARIIALVMATSLLTLTTEPLTLTDGLERLGAPFTRLGLPVHELALMVSISLRFIPTLMEHAERLMKAQMARGADVESNHPIRKVRALVPILVPLFVQAFRAADDLADAMESRGYRGATGRSRTFRQLQLTGADVGVLLGWTGLMGLMGWVDRLL